MADVSGKGKHQVHQSLTQAEAQDRVIAGSMDLIVNEKSPDDFSYEGGNDNQTGPSRGSAGDLRTLAATDNPDDLEK